MTLRQRVLTLTVGPISHGGHCVARHEGRVVFVRHAIPGETVRAVITEGQEKSKFWRADVIDVLEPSDHRRRHPWKQADALRAYDRDQLPVGGADYGHIADAHQRRLKSQVFRDTMQRIGGIDLSSLDLPGLAGDGELPVVQLPESDSTGMHWRTRVSFAVDGSSLAMKPHRSHALIPLRSMPLAVEALTESGIFAWDFSGASAVDVIAPGGQAPLTLIVRADDAEPAGALHERLTSAATSSDQVGSVILASARSGLKRAHSKRAQGRRRFDQLTPTKLDHRVLVGKRTVHEPLPILVAAEEATSKNSVELAPEGFWQIHRGAPSALVKAIDELVELPESGSAIDLYAGAGLFSAWAAGRLGAGGRVLSVEAAEVSSAAARRLFAGDDRVEVLTSTAERIVHRLQSADLVVLDPPRAGADRRVLHGIDASDPGQIVYVSCDPASYARDARVLLDRGWNLREIRLLDQYPNTHHMESVALFERAVTH